MEREELEKETIIDEDPPKPSITHPINVNIPQSKLNLSSYWSILNG
jgi:hypothetical protein